MGQCIDDRFMRRRQVVKFAKWILFIVHFDETLPGSGKQLAGFLLLILICRWDLDAEVFQINSNH